MAMTNDLNCFLSNCIIFSTNVLCLTSRKIKIILSKIQYYNYNFIVMIAMFFGICRYLPKPQKYLYFFFGKHYLYAFKCQHFLPFPIKTNNIFEDTSNYENLSSIAIFGIFLTFLFLKRYFERNVMQFFFVFLKKLLSRKHVFLQDY